MRPEVVAAMMPVFTEHFGNASSIHWFGQQAKAMMDDARQQVARLINAETAEVVFVSGVPRRITWPFAASPIPRGQRDGTLLRRVSSITPCCIRARISKSRDTT